MKLGLFEHMQKHDNPARSYVDLYNSHLDVLEFADQAGMDFYFVAEYYFDMGFCECRSLGSFLGATAAGADTFLGEFTFGMMEQRQAMNSLRLFAEQVMPELRKFEVDALNYPKAEA